MDVTADRLPAGLHPVVRRVLLARGVRSAEQADLSLSRLLPPERLGGVGSAADLLASAISGGERILVVGDFDADGATGAALAVLALRAMGAERVDFKVPNRFQFGYGLTAPLVDALAAELPALIVTVDSGICCNGGVSRANELGARVIVTDHHVPGTELPPAAAIVNPNLPGDAFPSKALAGVGVVFYLLGAVRRLLRERGCFGPRRPEPRMSEWLDLVALGTVADLVPLDHNNRILVHNGILRIRAGLARPGLMALMRIANRDYRHTQASDLGFAVGPRLNAAGRLEDMGVGIRCLLSDEPGEAMRLAEQLDALNRQRQNLQDEMQARAFETVNAMLARIRGRPLPPALCLYDPQWHQGIVGLVASKVKDAVHRPVIAFAPESAGSTALKGSARSVRGLHIRDVLACVDARHPGLIKAFGGHAMAAGLSLDEDKLGLFEQAVPHAVDQLLDGDVLVNEWRTDGELEAGEIGLELARALRGLGPWGQRFPEPLFDGRFEVVDERVVGEKHLKMVVRHAEGREALDAIAFNHLPEDLERAAGGSGPPRLLRMLYRLDINRWRGVERCQLVVEQLVGREA